MKMWKAGLIYLGVIALFFYYRNELANWLINEYPPIGLVFAAAVALAVFPVLPYKIIIGTLGFKYGPLLGALISWSAVSVASILLFLTARHFFREKARAYINRFAHAERLGKMIESRPFLTIFIARLIPFFPQGLVNLYPAFLTVRLSTYIAASSLGKIPAMLLFSYLGAQLFTDWRRALVVLAVYCGVAAVAYLFYRIWFKRGSAPGRS